MCQVNHQDPAGCALQYVHACDLATYRLYSVVCHVHWGGVQHTVCGCSWGENYSEWPVFHRPAVPCGRPAARDEINAECTRKLSEFIYKKKKKERGQNTQRALQIVQYCRTEGAKTRSWRAGYTVSMNLNAARNCLRSHWFIINWIRPRVISF